MKTMKLLFTLFFVAAAATGFGQIDGTAHDFEGLAWNTSGEICIVCHTPHNGDLTVTDAPLWNHEVSEATFTLYDGTTLDATLSQPDGESLLCLSCHDGSVALDSYSGTTGSTPIAGRVRLGTDLSNDHPISFTYDDALATTDGELFAPTTASSGLGSTIDADMLFTNRMQCSSCHDVHDDTNGSFLRMDNTGSALCLTCHNK